MEEETKELVLGAQQRLAEQMQETQQLFDFNEKIAEFSDKLFDSMQSLAEETGSSSRLVTRIKQSKQAMSRLNQNPELRVPLSMLYDQGVVRSVSHLEAFLKEIFGILVRANPDCVPEELFPLSIKRELVVEFGHDISTYLDQVLLDMDKANINFQDLQSTTRVLLEYFDIRIELSPTEKDYLILAAALRHIMLHRGNRVDRKFLKQVRGTGYAERFKEGEIVSIDAEEASRLIQQISKFAGKIVEAMEVRRG